MDYLTVKELAELKGCSLQHLQKQIKIGKIYAEQKLHPQNNKMCYMIPITSLPEELQAKYYKQKRTETGIMPEKSESEQPVKEPGLKYRSKGTKRTFDSFTAEEREIIRFWIDLLNEWQAERSKRKDKTEFDKIFVAHQKYINADINISPDILYRKYSAYKNECYEELIDKRGGWNKGKSKLADDSVIWQSFLSLYLDQSEPKISKCYRMVCAYIAEEYPELTVEIPSVACFRRKIETLSFAILEYSHKGAKAMHDHCVPHANRRKDAVYANDVWVMDNYTIDVIIKENENSEKTKRLYITTVLDVKSNVLVGWNITESPDSNSTLDALRFAMLRFGIPKTLYFDNGREFTTLDIAGEQRRRKVAKDKKGDIPLTIVEKLGIELIFAEVTNAQAKVVERIHRIIKEQYCTAQYGYCGGNVVERPEILKTNIKNGNIETEAELRETFADFADNIYNVQPYGSSETKYKGMTLIDVWNASIAETSIRKASAEVLDLLMLRNAGFQNVKRDGVFIMYHGEKIWYYDKNITWQHIGEKVCVRYDRNDPSNVRIYDTEDRYLFNWECADWLITRYFNESKEKLAELGRGKANVAKQIKARSIELKGGIRLTQKDGLKYLAKQNAGKFNIRMPKNIIPVIVNDEMPELKQAAGDENIRVPIDVKKITRNAAKRKE
ncbi:MAG: DDE-type integrase/transposase/recombinase [Ruminococcus flavefaciens]|nr:DDE-type integrase/transposase/recombinase [Ruminococcus flavefaciens]MCM1363319.1 DDE-type integrase/transposase/recombinase [Clostridiales bacterium]